MNTDGGGQQSDVYHPPMEGGTHSLSSSGISAILDRVGCAGESLNGLRPEVVLQLLARSLQSSQHDPLMDEVIALLRKAEHALLVAAAVEQRSTYLN